MLERFFPQIYIQSVQELPLDELRRRGVRALYFDIDNTLAPYDVAEPDPDCLTFLQKLRDEGFLIGLLSNNHEERIKVFNQKIGAEMVWEAGKPGVKKLRESMARLGVTPAQTALVGDQAFTDVYCGNRAGVLSILVAPLCDRDQWMTAIKRPLERPVLAYYFKKTGQKGHY